jgi:o-succinylbenzoate---CoA ligase
MSYPFPSLWINGRNVYLQDIIADKASAENEFEQNTFDFIKDWLGDKDVFEIQTSGSTGTPKKLIVTRDQMIASARMTEQALALKAGDTALVCLNTQYIAGRMMLVRCFTTGMRMVVTDPSANPLAYRPSDVSIDFTAFVPYQLYTILSSEQARVLNTIRCAIIGGAPLNTETIETLQAYTCQFYATYGMTETISHIALQALNGAIASSAFQALPGVTLGVDARGCLTIEAPHLEEKITTNDLVDLQDAMHFIWLGRWDNVINSGGVKIIPEHLESKVSNVLYRCGILRSFFIGSIPDYKLGEKIVLVLEDERPLNEKNKSKIFEEFKQSFSAYESPKEIFTITKFIYTDTHKINRRKTIEMLTKQV